MHRRFKKKNQIEALDVYIEMQKASKQLSDIIFELQANSSRLREKLNEFRGPEEK